MRLHTGILCQLETRNLDATPIDQSGSRWPTIRDYWKLKVSIIRSSLVGTLIGIFPGAGATIASFVSYDIAKRLSKTPEQFGQGSPEGISAAEAANSGSVGGALVPLLTLGIPGSASTAVLIGALMIHEVVPGPQLFNTNPDIVYGLFASLLIANVVLLGLGLFGSRLWIKVTLVPKRVLYPLIITISVVGSFAVRYSLFDVAACLGFGIFGWLLRRHQYPVVPIVLGMVLGTIAETNFRQAVMMGGYSVFLERRVCLAILIISVLLIVVPIWRGRKRSAKTTLDN